MLWKLFFWLWRLVDQRRCHRNSEILRLNPNVSILPKIILIFGLIKNIFKGRDGLLKSKTSCKGCFSEYLKALGFSILEGISLFLRIGCFLGLFKNFKRLKDSEKIIFKITKNHFLTNLSLCYLQLHDSVLRSGRLQLRTSGRDDNAPSCGKLYYLYSKLYNFWYTGF